jgi:hypothetical protein
MKKIVLFLSLALASVIGYSQVTSDFSVNDEGWRTVDASGVFSSPTYNIAGGNPTGNISAFAAVYFNFYFVAPSKFLGNLTTYYNGSLSFDLQQSAAGTPFVQAEVIVSDGTNFLYYFPATPFSPAVAPSWTSYRVPLNELSGEWKTANSNTATAATSVDFNKIFSNVTLFQVRAGFSFRSSRTNGLDNVLLQPFLITTQPTATTACDGAFASLTAVATGLSGITYQWQIFTGFRIPYSNVVDGGGYSGATTSTLNINTTGAFGAGTYRCVISGAGANSLISNSVAVGITALPTAPTSTGNSACGSASLTLSAFGGKGGQYRWYTQSSGGIAISGEVNGSYSTPSITSTTTYYVSINNGLCESLRTPVVATINTIPTAPTATGNSACGAAVITLNASGGSNGQYRWYTAATGGTPIAGEVNSSYVTPSLSSTATYYVAISTIACESTRTAVVATINTIPAAPSVTGNSGCGTSAVALNAFGGTNGQYRWYTTATGGTAITGEVNSSYTTPSLTNTTTYYVSINSGTCECRY